MHQYEQPLKLAILVGLHTGGTECISCSHHDVYKLWSKFGVKWSSKSQSKELKRLLEGENCYIAYEHHSDGPNHFKILSKESEHIG